MQPTFDQIMKYERQKWKGKVAQKSKPEAPIEKVEEVKPVETQEPEYEAMSRSDLFKIAKDNGYTEPWIASTNDTLIAWLKENV